MKTIDLKGTKVSIRRAKVKEVKDLIKGSAAQMTEVADIFYNKTINDEELIDVITNIIMENIEFFEKHILQFTPGFTQDNFDDLEFLDAIKLIKEIIIYNGIKGKLIKNFFQNFNQIMEEQAQPGMEFTKEVPKV